MNNPSTFDVNLQSKDSKRSLTKSTATPQPSPSPLPPPPIMSRTSTSQTIDVDNTLDELPILPSSPSPQQQPPPPPHSPSNASTIHIPIELKNLLAGGLSGMLSKSIVAPLDRVKILYQVTSVPFYVRNIPSVVAGIVRTEGFAALWRGNMATMVRIFPYAGVQFMVFGRIKLYCTERRRSEEGSVEGGGVGEEEESSRSSSSNSRERTTTEEHGIKGYRQRNDEKWGMRPMESLIAGSCAGAVSVLCTYPLDLTRAQLAVSKKHKLRGDGSGGGKKLGFLHILQGNYTKGGAQGLFRGITPTMLGILPYAGIAFTINEQAKRQIYNLTKRDPTTMEKILCGALSGLIAQSATYPLEVTRRRMQTIDMLRSSGNETAIGLLNTTTTNTTTNISTNTKLSSIHPSPPFSKTIGSQQTPTTMLSVMKEVIAEQGIRGFYKGLTMNWLKGPVSFAISFTAFDIVQGWMEVSVVNH